MNALIEHPDFTSPDRRTIFLPELKSRFLEHLSEFGNVGLACKRAGVSRQTAYRERRRQPAFAKLWDAAMIAARTVAEEALAERAVHGVEEPVFYHGEEVGHRRRYSDRLLLAHLARLDKVEAREDVSEALAGLDDAIAALARGEELGDELPCAPAPESLGAATSGGCAGRAEAPACAGARAGDRGPEENDPLDSVPHVPLAPFGTAEVEACDCPGARHGTDRGQPHFRLTADGPQPVLNVDGSGPCCDKPRWPECRGCPHYPPVARLVEEMEETRPDHAPPLYALGNVADAQACQMEAFEAGDPDWWRYGADNVLYVPDGLGGWCRADERDEDAGEADGFGAWDEWDEEE